MCRIPLFFWGCELMGEKLSLVIILTEGIRGHLNQARGIAIWLSELTGARTVEIQVPRLSGLEKLVKSKVRARFLSRSTSAICSKWLKDVGAQDLVDRITSLVESVPEKAEGCLLISAGNTPAPFNLSLARVFQIKNVVLMTPSVTSLSAFDFAVVPEHDFPPVSENLMLTLGAPNAIVRKDLEEPAEELARSFSPVNSSSWGILIGGDTVNYGIDPAWIKKNVGALLDMASEKCADLYITTSRRTRQDAEKTLYDITRGQKNVRMVLLASQDPRNPVPGMLGLCDRIFCTEDSVSMLSEAATSGKPVFLLRVKKKGGLKMFLGTITNSLVKANILPVSYLWGFYRFEYMRQRMIGKGLLVEMPDNTQNWMNLVDSSKNRDVSEFNEAKRAAEWILETFKR